MMALNYSVCMRKNPFHRSAQPKAYAVAQMSGELTLKELSRRVAQQTTVSRADVVAVLTSTVDNLFDGLREGKQVDFGELGKFRLSLMSEGAESLEKFSSSHILGVNIVYQPGQDLKNVFQGLEFVPVATRKAQSAALRAEKGGKDVVNVLDSLPAADKTQHEGKDEEDAGELDTERVNPKVGE